jgi:hypothetical protein
MNTLAEEEVQWVLNKTYCLTMNESILFSAKGALNTTYTLEVFLCTIFMHLLRATG